MTSVGLVRVWHFADGWGVIDSHDTPGGAYVLPHALRVEAVADLDGSPEMGLRPGTEVEFEWSAIDEPAGGMRYLIDRVWPRGADTPSREGAFHTNLWLSVDEPGPDGLTVMREDLDRNSLDLPAVEPRSFPTATGTVRFWHGEQGWGVLDADETPGGAWAHFSAIVGIGFRALDAGQSVEFDYEPVQQDGYDSQAVSVTGR